MKKYISISSFFLLVLSGNVNAQGQTLFVKKEAVRESSKTIRQEGGGFQYESAVERSIQTVRAMDVNFEGADASVFLEQNLKEADRLLDRLSKSEEHISLNKRADQILKKGSSGSQVVWLKQALGQRFPYLKEQLEAHQDSVFDERLDSIVREVQSQWGIEVDGIVSKQFYFNLYLTEAEKRKIVEKYKQKLEGILKEIKELDHKRVIIVNIPSFYLSAYGNGEVLQSVIIVGSESRRTPLGKMMMWGLKINPDWTPPPGIMGKDVLPALERGDLGVIRKKGLVITDTSGARVNPEELSGLSKQEIREMGLRFRQPAGDSNALGQLKFETDSRENIYLHDTNDRGLFSKSHRALSSGCVRVKEWEQLALWSSGWSHDQLQELVNKKTTKITKINNKIPIYTIHEQVDYIDGKWVFFPSVY